MDAWERRQREEREWVRMRREGNRDMGGCEVAVRLLLFKTPKPCQGQDWRERCVGVSVGLWSKYSHAKILWRVSSESGRAGHLRGLSMEGWGCSECQSYVRALAWSVMWREAFRTPGDLFHVKDLVMVSALISAQQLSCSIPGCHKLNWEVSHVSSSVNSSGLQMISETFLVWRVKYNLIHVSWYCIPL